MEGVKKMKIGDLVRLSAYGKSIKRAEWIDPNDVGLIIRIIKYSSPEYPPYYEVKWRSSNYGPKRYWHWQRTNTRADLKYVK